MVRIREAKGKQSVTGVAVLLIALCGCSERREGISCFRSLELPELVHLLEYPAPGKPRAYDVTAKIGEDGAVTVVSVEPDGRSRASEVSWSAMARSVGDAACIGRTVTVRYLFVAGNPDGRNPVYRVDPPHVVVMEVPGGR